MDICLEAVASENYKTIAYDTLKQIVLMRWEYNDDEIDGAVAFMREPPFGFVSFYVIALRNCGMVIGFAQFFRDEDDNTLWTYGDLEIHNDYRKLGIATRIIERGIQALVQRCAKKLLTFIDESNKPSAMLHEKLCFVRSANQDINNVYAGVDRIVYEYTL